MEVIQVNIYSRERLEILQDFCGILMTLLVFYNLNPRTEPIDSVKIKMLKSYSIKKHLKYGKAIIIYQTKSVQKKG